MPSLEAHEDGVPAVASFQTLLWDLLARAELVKPATKLTPALNKADFEDLLGRLGSIFQAVESKGPGGSDDLKKNRQFAIVETAVRDVFGRLISTTSIESPAFVKVWNLFDILLILGENGECDSNLLLWLTEELFESQTIKGCEEVLHYLESRRQRIIAGNFSSKKLVILRACNELLRRLSRAKDPTVCGRVFIFMFQCFPLGDKSSVNLRGEFHTENETTFDNEIPEDAATPEKMDVDAPAEETKASDASRSKKESSQKAEPKALKPSELYRVFWSLQESFSQPKKLFDQTQFAAFKTGMEATMTAFKQIANEHQTATKQGEESKRKLKRKRDDETSGSDENYNPKYLTSRDLFELETSDLTFRRYFLVQALILMDFLLSLTAEAKEKLLAPSGKPLNKSVMYSEQFLGEEDTVWVTKMKLDITDHIKTRTSDGAYFLRMVDTILARDRNWVRWKIESCPPIEMEAVTPENFSEAKDQARRATTSKRLRPLPMGSMSLDFMKDEDEDAELERLRGKERYALPDLEHYKDAIARDDFNIEMPKDNEEKARAEATKASKTWRALRIASRFKMATFDRIEDDNKIDIIFAKPGEEEQGADAGEAADLPEDQRPLVITGPTGLDYASLAKMLVEKSPGVYQAVVQHTTKPQQEGETYHYVDSSTFNMMLDGDKFLEFRDVDGVMYGTSQSMVYKIGDAGKVAVLALSTESVEQAKGMSFDARYVFVEPPSAEDLEARLKEGGTVTEEQLPGVLAAAKKEIEQARGADAGGYDKFITHDGDLEATFSTLDAFVYDREAEPEGKGIEVAQNGEQSGGAKTVEQPAVSDVPMADAAVTEGAGGANGVEAGS